MDNHKIFFALVSGFVLGILISSFFKLGFSFFILLLLLAGLIFLFGKFFAKTNMAVIILLAIFIFSFALGVLRYEIKEVRTEDINFTRLIGEKVVLWGTIIEEPAVKENSVQLIILTQRASDTTKEIVISEKVLVTAGLFPEFRYGDLIEVKGKLERPENFSTEMGKDFDYVGFLAKSDIFYRISFAQAEIISSGHGSFLKSKLFSLKNFFISKLNILIKEPESSLLNGLLLGAKNSLGQELQTDFRIAGVSHIVALSGYNITIVAEGIMVVLAFLPKALSLSFGILGIIFFAIMTGGSATVLRASIMAVLVLLARSTNRKYDISRALLLAGVFMLIENPKILVFDISFQLSFLATIALILVSPLLEKKMTFITEKYKIRELVVATVSTQMFVLPFIFYKMGLLSVFALLTNLLVLPVIPVIMFLGFLAGLIGFISLTLAWPIAFICSLLLTYVLQVITIIAGLPYASINIKSFSLSLTLAIYMIFFIVIWQKRKVLTQNTYEKS